jgi:hypothetical protein
MRISICVSFHFLDIADMHMKMGHLEKAQQACVKAEEGYTAIGRIRQHASDATRNKIEQKLNQLGARLQRFRDAGLAGRFDPPASCFASISTHVRADDQPVRSGYFRL